MRTTTALALACCVACGGGDVTDIQAANELVIVAGGSVTDTAQAHPLQALVVEVRKNGQPQPGMAVTFAGTIAADPNPAMQRTAWTSDLAYDSFTGLTPVTTNAMGRALVRVELGRFAGAAAIVVRCAALDLADTVHYTVLPGNAYRLVMTAADTAVLAGVSYPINASVTDRHGNRRDDVVTYSAGPNVVSVDGAGRVTVPNGVVRGATAIRSGGLLDSARFTVVPDGEIAYLDFTDVGTSAADGVITTSRMDGTRKKTWGKARSPALPKLSPTDSLVAYSRNDDLGNWSVFLVDRNGLARAFDEPSIRSARHPRFSADGRYVFLSGNPFSSPTSIWRLRTDASEPPLRVLATPDAYREPLFDVTADGRFIAYAAGPGAVIRDMATGQERALGTYASALEFSPDDERLAYIDLSGITIVRLDGSSPVNLGGRPVAAGELTWTRDGQWLLARDGTGSVLVNATSGQRVDVPFGDRFQFSTRR